MKRALTGAALALALWAAPGVAEARPHGYYAKHQVSHARKSFRRSHTHRVHRRVRRLGRVAAAGRAAAPSAFIPGRLICAVNVNAALAVRGVRGTGSALAMSFLRWGHASGPVPGAVAVYGRRGGGHVAIVSRVEGGRVWVLNPSARAQAWREVEYGRRALAFRVSG